jgi:uncharacterized LabA/DUF88 family protein
MRTAVYIDGFNLYYRAVRGTPYKWLDLKEVCRQLLVPAHVIVSIKYYTAPVSGKRDPGQPIRQQSYLRALHATIPELVVHQGHFLTHEVSAPLAHPAFGQPPTVRVLKTEEKGSDVNLAVHLLNDAWLDHYDCAVIISNDSDLAESMRLVRTHHPAKKIGLVFPRQGGAGSRHAHPSRELARHAHFVKHLGQTVLAACQLPDPIPGTSIHKPPGW